MHNVCIIKLAVIMLNVRTISGMALRPNCWRPLTVCEGVLHFSAISKMLQHFSNYLQPSFFRGYDHYPVKTHELITAPKGM